MRTKDNEKIILMERFRPLLESVECGEPMVFKFKDGASLQTAKDSWSWVNERDAHTFILITADGECGSDENPRQPYHVDSVEYDETANTARLRATQKTWKEVAHTFDLEFGTVAMHAQPEQASGGAHQLVRRQSFDKSLEYNLGANHTGPLFDGRLPRSILGVKLDCVECVSRGKVLVSGKVSLEDGVQKELKASVQIVDLYWSYKVASEGVAREYVSVSYTLTPVRTGLDIPLEGISIPHVTSLGLFFKVKPGVGVRNFVGELNFTAGATFSAPGTTQFEVDFLNMQKPLLTGWQPQLEKQPVVAGGKWEGEFQVYTQYALCLESTIFDNGFQTYFQLRVPEIRDRKSVV